VGETWANAQSQQAGAEASDSGGAGAKPRAMARGGQRGAERWAEAVECNRLYRSGFKES